MVLIHKLKQIEELDIEQFRDHFAEEKANDALVQNKQSERKTSEHLDKTLKRRLPSPPRRPLTRSQTLGPGATRKRDREDTAVDTDRKPRPSRRPVKRTRTEPILGSNDRRSTVSSLMRTASEASTSVNAPSPTPHAFHDSSVGPDSDQRGPRSRVVLPVPVPNLTKKSRGRRVPTNEAIEQDEVQKATRVYICKVDDCGKCFHRGEHLKRHIRSIHTHEKPFKCSHPACDKFFNRHDNLLQHLKVHKDLSPSETSADIHQPKQPPAKPRLEEFSVSPPRYPITLPPAYPSYTSYGTGTEPMTFATNMAVSSLRTEMPHSPLHTMTRESDLRTRPQPEAHIQEPHSYHSPPLLPLRPALGHDWQA